MLIEQTVFRLEKRTISNVLPTLSIFSRFFKELNFTVHYETLEGETRIIYYTLIKISLFIVNFYYLRSDPNDRLWFLENHLSLSVSRNLQSGQLSNFTGHQYIITKHLLVKFDSYPLEFVIPGEKGDFLITAIGHLGLNRGRSIF